MAREEAFRVVYGLGFVGADEREEDVPGDLGLVKGKSIPKNDVEYARSLVKAVSDNLVEIDEIIKKHAVGFSFDRIFKADLAALRLGIAELKYMKHVESKQDSATPPPVVISAVVDIVKKYSTEKSHTWVHGILGKVVK